MAKKHMTRKFSAALYVFLRLTFIPYLLIKYRIRSRNKDIFKKLKPPFILIPNHVSMFDPPMVNIFVPHRVHFVMSDANMRTKIGRWAYGTLCNVIPKTKVISDSAAVRKIVQLVRKKRVICVFAEGRSSWDGVTHNIFYSTSKLLKVLKIPVVVPLIRGGYLTHPRWSTSVRPGRLIIDYKKIFDGPELGHMTPQRIHQRLVAELSHDDYEFQRETGQKYRSKKGAEYLERLLFICPECQCNQTLRSEGNRFFCTSCSFEKIFTAEGCLRSAGENEDPPHTITEQLKIQNSTFEQTIRNIQKLKSSDPIFTDQDVALMVGYKLDPLKRIARGTLALYLDRFTFTSDSNRIYNFPIDSIHGVQVLLANKFEFYFEGAVYYFKFKDPRTSGYKYMCAIQKIAPEKTELK